MDTFQPFETFFQKHSFSSELALMEFVGENIHFDITGVDCNANRNLFICLSKFNVNDAINSLHPPCTITRLD